MIYTNAENIFDLDFRVLLDISVSLAEGDLLACWSIGNWGIDCEIRNDKLLLTADYLVTPLSTTNSRRLVLPISENYEETRRQIAAFSDGLPK